MIRLTSFLCLWFQCVCTLMPFCNTYRLTWVCLTLDMGYLFTAAPAKRSRCSLPWTRGISSPPPLLTLNVNSSFRPSCARAATAPLICGCSSQPLPLASGGGISSGLLLRCCSLALLAAAPDLGRFVAPLSCLP